MKNKLFPVILLIIISLILIEFSLRAAGRIYYSVSMNKEQKVIEYEKNQLKEVENRYVVSPEDKNLLRIVCLGDSWTFGSGAAAGYSYPAQLQKLFNKENVIKYKVYNLGIPGNYSAKILRYLPGVFNKYKPNIVIIFTGLNDLNNYRQSDSANLLSWPKGLYSRFSSMILDLRVCKLIRYGLDGLMQKTRTLRKHTAPINEKIRFESIQLIRTGYDLYTAGKFKLGEAYFKKALMIDPGNEEACLRLGHLFQSIGQYAESLTYYQKVIDINPYTEFRAELYEFLFHTYQQQTHLSSEINKKIIYLAKRIPSDDTFKNPGAPFIIDRNVTMINLGNNLIKIIDFVRSRKAVPILQTYNGSRPYINDFIINFSEKHNVLLIDNREILREASDTESLFTLDEHPNEKGYVLIAENIYNLLKNMEKQNRLNFHE